MLHFSESFEDFANLQKSVELKLLNFFDFFWHVIEKPSWKNSENLIKDSKRVHTRGAFITLLNQSPKISKENFDAWNKDVEHGFFHGFITSFYAYSLYKNKQEIHDLVDSPALGKSNKDFSKGVDIFYSCLFHDFVKSAFEKEPHDELLKDYFPLCTDDTYFHSNGEKETILVLSDRLELTRYKDYENWVDCSKISNQIEIFGEKEFCHFLNHIRPFLENIINFQDDVWAFHSDESKKWLNLNSYQHKSFFPEVHWSIENLNKNIDEKKYVCCFSKYINQTKYGLSEIEYGITGLIPKTKIKNHGNEICALPLEIFAESSANTQRDHPFILIENKIPIKEWNFVYNDVKEIKNIAFYKCNILSAKTLMEFIKITNMIKELIHSLKVN
jgi:hypothetical protein